LQTFKDRSANEETQPVRESDFENTLGSCLSFFENFDLGHPGGIKFILKFALELLQVRVVQFGYFNHECDTIHVREQDRCYHGTLNASSVSATTFFDPFVAENGEIAICQDLQKSDCRLSNPDIRAHGLRAYLGCPVKIDGRIIGSLMVFDSKPRIFNTLQIFLIKMIAVLVACVEAHMQIQTCFENRLNESEALNYQMLQLSPAAIYTIDLVEQRFLAVNEQMCRSSGYSEEELLAMKPFDLLTPKSRMLFVQRCKAMSAGQPVSTDVELEVITKSGDIEWGQFHIRHLYKDRKITGANVVAHFITEQKRVREELARYRKQLEALVQARTAELARTNAHLREEIERRAEATQKLRASSDSLQEMNTAMRVLLDKRTEDHQRAEEIIRTSLKELIDPYLQRLENSGLRGSQKQLLDVIRMNLDEVVGSSMPELSSKYYMLSPNEVHVVNLVRKGKTTKEMSRLLNLSVRTIEAYRNSIRKKFNLKNKKVNLRTYLSSI
jgi:PAS domain S-box-containing protein